MKAGLTLSWSNGQTEGQVHRLKLIKRQMYGRGSFKLLRKRVLHRAETKRHQRRKPGQDPGHSGVQERLQKEQAQHLAEQERLRAERLAERLRALGLDPEQP